MLHKVKFSQQIFDRVVLESWRQNNYAKICVSAWKNPDCSSWRTPVRHHCTNVINVCTALRPNANKIFLSCHWSTSNVIVRAMGTKPRRKGRKASQNAKQNISSKKSNFNIMAQEKVRFTPAQLDSIKDVLDTPLGNQTLFTSPTMLNTWRTNTIKMGIFRNLQLLSIGCAFKLALNILGLQTGMGDIKEFYGCMALATVLSLIHFAKTSFSVIAISVNKKDALVRITIADVLGGLKHWDFPMNVFPTTLKESRKYCYFSLTYEDKTRRERMTTFKLVKSDLETVSNRKMFAELFPKK